MFYLDPKTSKRYYLNQAFSYGGFNYPGVSATHEKFTELGFTKVVPQPRPDPRFYYTSRPNDDGSYTITPRDLQTTQLNFVREQLNITQGLLVATDWLFIRANEMSRGVDVAVPSAVITGRDEARNVCDTNCDLIMATEDIPQLEALIKAPAVVQKPGEDPTPNPEPHLEEYPEVDPEEYLTRALLAPKTAATPKGRRK